MVRSIGFVGTTQLDQQVPLELFASGYKCLVSIAVEQFECFVSLVLCRQDLSQALTCDFTQGWVGRFVGDGLQLCGGVIQLAGVYRDFRDEQAAVLA